MIIVVCFLMGVASTGQLIEKHGDAWLVKFETVTKEVNSNNCLIK